MFDPGARVYVLSQYDAWCGKATVIGPAILLGYHVKMDDGRDFLCYDSELCYLN